MTRTNTKEPPQPILANRARIIRRDGTIVVYSHVMSFKIIKSGAVLALRAERDGKGGMRVAVEDEMWMHDIISLDIEFRADINMGLL